MAITTYFQTPIGHDWYWDNSNLVIEEGVLVGVKNVGDAIVEGIEGS